MMLLISTWNASQHRVIDNVFWHDVHIVFVFWKVWSNRWTLVMFISYFLFLISAQVLINHYALFFGPYCNFSSHGPVFYILRLGLIVVTFFFLLLLFCHMVWKLDGSICRSRWSYGLSFWLWAASLRMNFVRLFSASTSCAFVFSAIFYHIVKVLIVLNVVIFLLQVW